MTLVLAFITRKGGSGKTTITRLMAGEFAFRDMTVHLIDADDQPTLGQWMDRLKKNKSCPKQLSYAELKMHGDEDETITSLVDEITANQDKDVILIDSKGVASKLGLIASRMASMVIIPSRPHVDDTQSAIATANAIMAAVPEGENAPIIRFLLNAVPTLGGGTAIRDAALEMAESGFTVLQTPLHQRQIIAEMNNGDGTLYTMPGQGREYVKKAKAEVETLIDRIERILTKGFDDDELPSEDADEASPNMGDKADAA